MTHLWPSASLKRPEGSFWQVRGGGGVEGWWGALFMLLPPKERGQGELWCLGVRGPKNEGAGPCRVPLVS